MTIAVCKRLLIWTTLWSWKAAHSAERRYRQIRDGMHAMRVMVKRQDDNVSILPFYHHPLVHHLPPDTTLVDTALHASSSSRGTYW